MDGLILAAGLGSRLRGVEPCKPLTKLHGMSLLEISVRQLASVGVSRCVVANGYLADTINAELSGIADRSGITVEWRQVENYNRPNGYSVLEGAADFAGDFFLVMADHIFSAPVLQRLAGASMRDDGIILAVDQRTASHLIDPEDATWVARRPNGQIKNIGKTIADYDCVDTGAFRASSALPQAIAAAIQDGKEGSLSDGIQRLADQGHADTVDIGDAWWIDVDDARALELANAEILEHLPELFSADAVSSAMQRRTA